MAKWIVCLVFGVLCVIGGTVGESGFDSGDISCGSEDMGPGDICEETRNGVTERMTYDEMVADEKANERAYQTWGRWVLLGVGVVLLGGGVAGIVKRKRTGHDEPAPQVPMAQPGFPPPTQPGYPPQAQQAPPSYQPGPPPQYHQNMPAPQQQWPQSHPRPPGGFGPQG